MSWLYMAALVVAARSWGDFDRMVATLKTLEDSETLIVQVGPSCCCHPHPRGMHRVC